MSKRLQVSALPGFSLVLLACLGLEAFASPVAAQTVRSDTNEAFAVQQPPVIASPFNVTDASSPKITAANDIRVRIPVAFNMTWNTTITTATITGSAAGKVSTTVRYEDYGHTVVIDVTTNFAGSDQIRVTGLGFTSFTAPSPQDRLQLVVSGPGGSTVGNDPQTKVIVAPTISSAANQTFTVGQAPTAAATITIQEPTNPPTIKAATDIRIRIPDSFRMTWNTTITTVTFGGGANANVVNPVSYEDGGKTVVIDAVMDFAGSNTLTISGLGFMAFTAPSPADSLQLVVSGPGGGSAALDSRFIKIIGPSAVISSAANQTFVVGDPSTVISPVDVLDASPAPTITASGDIRFKIPAGFNANWDPSVTTVTVTGTGASKVSSTVTYSLAAKEVVLNVTANFAAANQITVSGLKMTGFTAVSGPASLGLITGGGDTGPIVATDDKIKTIAANLHNVAVSPHVTTANQLPSNATTYTVSFTVQNTGTGVDPNTGVGQDSYDLLMRKVPGTALATIAIAGAGVSQGANPDSARLTNLANAASALVTVTYSVGTGGMGATDTLVFRARSVGAPSVSDSGRLTLTVVRPSLTIGRAASLAGPARPGTNVTYTLTVTNDGTSNAAGVTIVDTLASTVQFKVGSVTATLPAGVAVVVQYSNDRGATWAYVPASAACGAPAGYDACVNGIRWQLQNPLSYTTPNNSGTLQFVARIR